MDGSDRLKTDPQPAEVEALLDGLRSEALYERKLVQLQWTVALYNFVCGLIWALSRFWLVGKPLELQVLWTRTLALPYIGVNVACFVALHRLDRARRKRESQRHLLVPSLQEDARAVRSLLALNSPQQSKEMTARIGGVLKQLLPRLQGQDARTLLPEHRQALRKLLRSTDTDLVLAVLKALEQIGDWQAIEPVERLLARTGDAQIAQAAQSCLSELRIRAEEREKERTLLRPASLGADSPENLLHPTERGTEAPEHLLRSVNSER
jgi:hypothetical protein